MEFTAKQVNELLYKLSGIYSNKKLEIIIKTIQEVTYYTITIIDSNGDTPLRRFIRINTISNIYQEVLFLKY